MLQILVDSVDRTEDIMRNSLSISLEETSQVDLATFMLRAKQWVPVRGDEVAISWDSNLLFAGRVVDVNISEEIYRVVNVVCQDWSVDLDRKLIAKVYNNITAKAIIEDIVAEVNSATGETFTTNNVAETATMGKVVFNYQQASKCIEELARVFGYHWYIDAEKDIHFFARGDESAPFSIGDTSDDVIAQTLQVNESLSELRNVVVIQGGEFVGETRSEEYTADGVQKVYNLAYKYANLPTVTVDGNPQNIGVEFLDNEALDVGTFDALWDYNQKYLRWRVAPTDTEIVVVSGTPLFPLIVLAEDVSSISIYGRKEHIIKDPTITSIDVAVERASSELEAYKDGVSSGSFRTYTHGLRAGQTITINNSLTNASGSYLIRSVRIQEHGLNGLLYTVSLASDRVLGIIDLLQSLILKDRKLVGIRENEIPNIIRTVNESVGIVEEVNRRMPRMDQQSVGIEEMIRIAPFTPTFVLSPYEPVDEDDPYLPGLMDSSMYVYQIDPNAP